MTGVSVIVSNLNGARYLPRLLESLESQRDIEVQTVVVDRRSSDASRDILRGHPNVVVVDEPPETGLVAGYAAGLAEAAHPLLFFCNEDIYLDRDCLAELAARIDTVGRVGAADPWQWTYDGATWIHGGVRFRKALWDFTSPYPFRRQNPIARLTGESRVPFGSAGAVLVDASMYAEIGGWDTTFFLDDEDVDFFLRAWQRDWHCITVPTARVFHAVGASNAQVAGRSRQPVSRRRYVSNRANVSIIAFKYFSPALAPLGLAMWLTTVAKDLLLLRRARVWLDVLALAEIVRRFPDVIRFRRANRRWNAARPGEMFFVASEFADDPV